MILYISDNKARIELYSGDGFGGRSRNRLFLYLTPERICIIHCNNAKREWKSWTGFDGPQGSREYQALNGLTKERAHLEPMVETWRGLERTRQEIEEAEDIL